MAAKKKRKPTFTIQRGNVNVPGYKRNQVKNGKLYLSYAVPDHRNGTRKLWTFANLTNAKEKATEIAEATASGKIDVLDWQDGLRADMHAALDAIKPTGMSILPACQLFAQAVNVVGGPDELLVACQHWKLHRPNKPLTQKTVKCGVQEYLLKQTKISRRRLRTVTSYLRTFYAGFGDLSLHGVGTVELRDFADARKWAGKTFNEFLCAVGLLYKEAELRNWVPKGFNPTRGVRREKLKGATIHVFEPWEAKQLLSRVDAELHYCPGISN